MPEGKGTYGSQLGRPPKKREGFSNGGSKEYAQRLLEKQQKEKILKLKEAEARRIEAMFRNALLKEEASNVEDRYAKLPEVLKKQGKQVSDKVRNLWAVGELSNSQMLQKATEIPAILPIQRTKKAEGGEINEQMSMLMEEEQPMLPDEEMEEDYVEFVMDSALDEKDKEYLESALAADGKLSEIFDQVIESATEFSGSGPIEGPGSGMSDSIPARLSDGEFVLTAKATEEIGADNLQRMMEDAEAGADQRLQAYGGGSIEEPQVDKVVETTTSTRVLKPTSSTTPMLGQREEDVLQDALTTNMLNRTTKHVQS